MMKVNPLGVPVFQRALAVPARLVDDPPQMAFRNTFFSCRSRRQPENVLLNRCRQCQQFQNLADPRTRHRGQLARVVRKRERWAGLAVHVAWVFYHFKGNESGVKTCFCARTLGITGGIRIE
jgi:hypothetical protein